jgi:hypothetical protein
MVLGVGTKKMDGGRDSWAPVERAEAHGYLCTYFFALPKLPLCLSPGKYCLLFTHKEVYRDDYALSKTFAKECYGNIMLFLPLPSIKILQ